MATRNPATVTSREGETTYLYVEKNRRSYMSGPVVFFSGEIWLPSKPGFAASPKTPPAAFSRISFGLPNVVGMYQQGSSQAHDTV